MKDDDEPPQGGSGDSLTVLLVLLVRGGAMWLYIPLAVVIWPLHAAASPAARVRLRTYCTWFDEWFVYALLKILRSSRSLQRPELGHPKAGKVRLTDAW